MYGLDFQYGEEFDAAFGAVPNGAILIAHQRWGEFTPHLASVQLTLAMVNGA